MVRKVSAINGRNALYFASFLEQEGEGNAINSYYDYQSLVVETYVPYMFLGGMYEFDWRYNFKTGRRLLSERFYTRIDDLIVENDDYLEMIRRWFRKKYEKAKNVYRAVYGEMDKGFYEFFVKFLQEEVPIEHTDVVFSMDNVVHNGSVAEIYGFDGEKVYLKKRAILHMTKDFGGNVFMAYFYVPMVLKAKVYISSNTLKPRNRFTIVDFPEEVFKK